jgi:hypothetical protein
MLRMEAQFFKPMCSAWGDVPHTVISSVWTIIKYGFSHYWYIIIPAIVLWVIYEISTKNTHYYNSDNGFTPLFNSFIGGGVFCLFEALIYFFLILFVGKIAPCTTLFMSSFYLLPFIMTGLFLHLTRFWPYWKLPLIRAKIRLY